MTYENPFRKPPTVIEEEEIEKFEKEQRAPIVDMLKRAVPNFEEWAKKVLSNPDKKVALESLESFEEGIFVLPEDLQKSWKEGERSDIYFSNSDNKRQFRVIYSIVETEAPNQQFRKSQTREKTKGVFVKVGYTTSDFEK